MKSYTNLSSLYKTLTKNSSSTNSTFGDEMINDQYRHICALKDFSFLHRERTLTTIANTQFIPLPYDVELVETVSVLVGSTTYTPKLMHSREEWNLLNQTDYTSDTPRYAFVQNGEIGLWPKPSSGGNTIFINGKIRVVDLSVADYTTGTITDVTNGSGTVVGATTVWTTPMVNRFLRIGLSDDVKSGDGVWYEIGSITDGTNIELIRKYGGTSITGATQTYIIGQMPILPEAFHDTPVYYAASIYWDKEGDAKRASRYMEKYDRDVKTLESQYTSFVTDPVLQEASDGDSEYIINPNLTVEL